MSLNKFSKLSWMIPFLTSFIVLTIVFLVAETTETNSKTYDQKIQSEQTVQRPAETPQPMPIFLERHYLDGEVIRERSEEIIWSVEDFWAKYDDWELVDQNQDRMIFRKEMNDLSPTIKLHGYFGIDDTGRLTIYNGRPTDGEIVQTFSPIETEKLEARCVEQLQNGIPVRSKNQYEQLTTSFQAGYCSNEVEK